MFARGLVLIASVALAAFACAKIDSSTAPSTDTCRPLPCPPGTDFDYGACTCRLLDADAATDAAAIDTCSTGRAYDATTQFPTDEENNPLPTCIPRCGAVSHDGFYQIDALPSGACAVEGKQCAMGIHFTCANPSAFGHVDDMRCECESGQWRCVISVAGAGACPHDDDADIGDH